MIGTGRTAWCVDCGLQVTDVVFPDSEGTDNVCEHCGQWMVALEDGTQQHERTDLKAPACPVHKAELVEHRRAAMRKNVVQGGC